MSNTNVKANNAEKTTARIEVVDPIPFGGNMKSNLISTMEMAEIVSGLFGGVFRDYAGCKIRINDGRGLPAVTSTIAMGALYVDLYFKEQPNNGEGKRVNLITPTKKENNGEKESLSQRFTRVCCTAPGRMYTVTKETYECLEEFVFAGIRPNWNNYTQEITAQTHPYAKDEVFVVISGLDLNRIISKIYGTKTAEGRFEYRATPSTVIPNKADEFIITVSQLDLETINDLQTTLGIYMGNAPSFHPYNR